MSERVQMPALGESVTEGTVTRWLKGVGDEVAVDEPLLEVSTDKVDTEIPSPVAGTLQEILVQEDDTVPVGADLAVIGDGPASGGGDSAPEQSQEQSSSDGPADEVADPADTDAVAEAGDEGGQEPAEPQSDGDAQEQPAPSSEGSSGGSGDGTTVQMPALGESVTEGTVTRWLKSEGDEVAVDEPLLEVSTDKVDTEIPSPVAGTLTKILVQEDETVPVGADLAVVGGSGGGSAPAAEPEQAPAQAEEAPAKEDAPEPEPQQTAKQEEPAPAPADEAPPQEKPDEAAAAADEAPAATTAPSSSTSTAPTPRENESDASSYVTPLVRKLAADHGIDLASVTGTGIGGRIRKQDVLAAAEAKKAPEPEPEAPAAAPAPQASSSSAPAAAAKPAVDNGLRGTTQPMSRLRKTIARRMVESLQVSAQLTTVVEVDVTRISRLRDRPRPTSRSARARSSASCRSSPSPRSRRSRRTRPSTRASRTTR